MTVEFIAEHIPAYEIEPWADQPWRDEDRGLSAVEKIGTFNSEAEALAALAKDLRETADYYWDKSFNSQAYMADYTLFNAAVHVVQAGSTCVKVHGRYYRVRPVEVKN